jgi:cysteine desulfurase
VPLAAAFGVAATLAADASVRPVIASLRNRFESALQQIFGINVVIHGAHTERVPNTSSVMFRGADAEGIAIALDLDGIAVSTGSACSSGRVEPSGVLLAMGLAPEEAKSTVRVSLSRFTTGRRSSGWWRYWSGWCRGACDELPVTGYRVSAGQLVTGNWQLVMNNS